MIDAVFSLVHPPFTHGTTPRCARSWVRSGPVSSSVANSARWTSVLAANHSRTLTSRSRVPSKA